MKTTLLNLQKKRRLERVVTNHMFMVVNFIVYLVIGGLLVVVFVIFGDSGGLATMIHRFLRCDY